MPTTPRTIVQVVLLLSIFWSPLQKIGFAQSHDLCQTTHLDLHGSMELGANQSFEIGLALFDQDQYEGQSREVALLSPQGLLLHATTLILNQYGDAFQTWHPDVQSPGIYDIRYECASGEYKWKSIKICRPPVYSVDLVPVSCAGFSNGSISIEAAGQPNLEFQWSNGQSGPSIDGLSPGHYSVTITDPLGCQTTDHFQLRETPPLEASLSIGQYMCQGRLDRLVKLDIKGGTPPYQMDWSDDGLGDMDDQQNLLDASEGFLELVIEDARGCQRRYTVDVDYDDTMELDTKWIQLQPVSSASGEFVFNLSSTMQMAYGDIDNDGKDGSLFDVSFHENMNAALDGSNALSDMVHSSVRDTLFCRVETFDGCYIVSMVELMVNNYCLLVSEACSNGSPVLLQPVECTVAMPALPSGGTYDAYKVEGMTRTLDNSILSCDPMTGDCYLDPTDAEGNYEIHYTYPINGTPTTRVALFDIQDLNPQILAFQDSICGNEVTVAIRVNPSGGTLEGPAITGELIVGTNQFFFMNPRELDVDEWYSYTYTYSQTNASGLVCTKVTTDSFFIKNFPSVEIQSGQTSFCRTQFLALSAINVSPNATQIEWRDPDGIIIGNTPDLTYANAQKSGSYSVKVYTVQGCVDSAEVNVEILELPDLDCDATVRVTCPGGGDAIATVEVRNVADLTGYTFQWSNGGTGVTQSGLSAGDYTVTVTNPNGCSDSCIITVTQPPVFDIECDHVLQEVQCYGSFTGVDSLHVTGGTPPYRYSKDGINFQMSPIITGLSGGNQTVYVIDANDCLDSCSFSMPEPPEMDCEPGAQGMVSCAGGDDGMAEVMPLGGVPPYDITWSTGDTTNLVTGLMSGVYYVSIVDGNGCLCVDSAVISEPLELQLMCTIDSLDCFGLGNGQLSVNISGGVPPYETEWSTGARTTSISGLSAGTYWAMVSDQNGCMTSCTTHVIEPPALTVNCISDSLLCHGESNGRVEVQAMGGTPPYTYLWSTGDTTAAVSNLPAGNYSVLVMDAKGCVNDSCVAVVSEPDALGLTVSRDSVCLDFSETIESQVSGGTGNYSYQWRIEDPGTTGAVDTNLITPNDQNLEFSSFCLKPGTVQLGLTVTDENGCTIERIVPFDIHICFDLAIRKTVEKNKDYQPGDVAKFYIQVYNQGTIDAFDLVVRDSMEEFLDFLPDMNLAGQTGNLNNWVQNGNVYEIDLPFVPHGESRTLTYFARINQSFDGFELTNYSEIVDYSSAVKRLPLDEDDVPPGVLSVEYDNDIDDDKDGLEDNPVDEDRRDFAKIFLCDLSDMACNDLVQVTLDEFGRFVVTPDVLLEGKDNLALITQSLRNGQGQPIGDILDCSHIGDTITFRVDNGCNQTACWGKLIVEDKMPPRVNCARPDTFFCFETGDQYLQDTVTDNCGGITRRILSDTRVNYPCDSTFSGRRTIVSVYEDAYGNVSDTCTKLIYFRNFKIEEIDFPSDTIIPCSNFQSADPLLTGVPQVNSVDVYPNFKSCSVAFKYSDDTINVCGATRKIIRTWTAFDWCADRGPNNPYRQNQLIKVLDEEAPILYCPGTADAVDTVSTDVQTCLATFELPEPHVLLPGQPIVDSMTVYVIAECSDFTYSVQHLPAQSPTDCNPGNGQPTSSNVRLKANGRWEAFDLSLGCHWFYYTVTDACGNSTVCAFDIFVRDETPPIAVCDAHTVVSLGLSGQAELPATSVDDGSVDNCQIDTMLVRRMDGAPCGGPQGFKPKELFCCEDLGKTIMVEFAVWDEAGNSNQCMVEVKVQNKIPPQLIYCPPDLTIDCQEDFRDTTITGGQARFEATCDLDVTFRDVTYLDACGIGFVERTWLALDLTGKTQSSCTQIITIIDTRPLTSKDIDWPNPFVEINLNQNCDVNPDPSISGEPEVNPRGCSDVAMTYKDLRLTKDSNSCFKVLRNWTVIDWCTYDVNTGAGKFEFEQTIAVKNNESPVVACRDSVYCDVTDGCSSLITIFGRATDDCTPDDDLIWRIDVDLENDGQDDFVRLQQQFDYEFPYGTHRITYTVRDGCDNESTCSEVIEVRDCKHPTPICKNGITTVVMPSTGEISIWASDFNDKSFDNCTPNSELEISFSEDVHDKSRTYTCEDLDGLRVDTFEVEVWVTDEAGNQDFCRTIVIIQDNQGVCDTNTVASITGRILTKPGAAIPATQLDCWNVNDQTSASTQVDDQGIFTMTGTKIPSHVEISAQNNTGLLDGVSTRDIVFLQQILLGKRDFDETYLQIAADVDNNRRITVGDVLAIRKAILGHINEFPNGQQSWRFVPAVHDFDNAIDVLAFPEQIRLDVLEENIQGVDFNGIKIADVDGTLNQVTGNSTRNFLTWKLETAHEESAVVIRSGQDLETSGFQMAFEWDDTRQPMVSSERLDIQPHHWNVIDGELRISWSGMEPLQIEKGEVLLMVEGTENLELIEKGAFVSEWYDGGDMWGHFQLEQGNDISEVMHLYQNVPNPFDQSTTIPFDLFKPGEIEVSVYTSSGRVVHVVKGYYNRGRHELRLSHELLGHHGLMYYRITGHGQSEIRKMIKLD